MSEPFVVEVVRSGSVESVHLVDVAVVDGNESLVAQAGDPDTRAAYRSSAKPIQARAALEVGWTPADTRALAIACASHNGEHAHVHAVREVLSAAGVDERALRCPPDVPLSLEAALGIGVRAPIYHNCSGKHAAMLAACTAAGWPLETYLEPGHPLQVRVRDLVESLAGPVEGPLVDGCGVPTFTAPLRGLALGFLRIDGGDEAAAMRVHPFLVGGTSRLDTDLMSVAPAILSKGGAEGLVCLSAGGLGIAVKSRDGTARSRGPVALAVLRELDLIGDAELEALPQHREPAVLGGGRPVGMLRARGALAGR
jgi:L-asparaginase II